jgi:hypothetical protein
VNLFKNVDAQATTGLIVHLFCSAMIRKTLLVGAPIGLLSAAVIVQNNGDEAKSKNQKLICKPSQLPIYTSLVDRCFYRCTLSAAAVF